MPEDHMMDNAHPGWHPEFWTFLRNSARQPQRRLANPYSSLYIKHTHEDSVIICSVAPVRHTLDSAQPGGAHSTWHTPRTAHNPVAHLPSGAQWRTPRCAPTANGAQPGGTHHGWGTPRRADTPGGTYALRRTTPCDTAGAAHIPEGSEVPSVTDWSSQCLY